MPALRILTKQALAELIQTLSQSRFGAKRLSLEHSVLNGRIIVRKRGKNVFSQCSLYAFAGQPIIGLIPIHDDLQLRLVCGSVL